jgi:hypothetical protein
LGTSLAQAAPLNFTAKVQEKSASHWVVALDATRDSNQGNVQHRELQAASCDELAQAVSVAIALALGADALQPKESPAQTPLPAEATEKATPEPPAPVATNPSRAAATPKKSDPKNSYWWAAELGPSLDVGSLPGPAFGIEVSALAGKGAFGLKLGGLALPRRSAEVVGNLGGTFTLLAASLMACASSSHAVTNLRLCGGSEFGKLSGTGLNTTHSRTNGSSWVAPRIDIEFSWPLLDESLRLFGLGTVAMPLIRNAFTVHNLDTGTDIRVFQPGSVIGRIGAGLELLWQ